MPELLDSIRVSVAPQYTVGAGGIPGQKFIYRSDRWIYVHEDMGVLRINAATGEWQIFHTFWRRQRLDLPGIYAGTPDHAQPVNGIAVSPSGKWIVHGGDPRYRDSAGTVAALVHVLRTDRGTIEYHGQLAPEQGDLPAFWPGNVHVGDDGVCWLKQGSVGTRDRWVKADVDSLTILNNDVTTPPPFPPEQESLPVGVTYTGIVGGRIDAATNTQFVLFARVGATVEVPAEPPPPQPPVVTPPRPPPGPAPQPPVSEPCPPGYSRNILDGRCYPDGFTTLPPPAPTPAPTPTPRPPTMSTDLRLMNGRFNVTCRYDATDRNLDAGPALAAKYSEQSGVFTFFSVEKWEVVVSYATAAGGLMVSAMTDVAFVLTVTNLQSGETKQLVNEAGNLLGKVVTIA